MPDRYHSKNVDNENATKIYQERGHILSGWLKMDYFAVVQNEWLKISKRTNLLEKKHTIYRKTHYTREHFQTSN